MEMINIYQFMAEITDGADFFIFFFNVAALQQCSVGQNVRSYASYV
jgi:hypothetical protein